MSKQLKPRVFPYQLFCLFFVTRSGFSYCLQEGLIGCTYYRVYKHLETFANRANPDTLEQQAAKETQQGNHLTATIWSTMSPL